jgi:hypothetical protein
MLDVHPPHSATHTWKDFFIHIATIVVGLLIAVGLEQTVERVHQHYELRETREALANESKANEKDWVANESDWRRTFVELKNNLMVLEYVRAHRGLAETELPGDLEWQQSPFQWKHAVWDAAKLKGVTQRMDLSEANSYENFYEQMVGMGSQSLEAWTAINEAHRFDLVDPDPTHLTPLELDEVIRLTSTALEKHITFGYSFGRYAHDFPERPHTITWGTMAKLIPEAAERDPQGMAAAHAKTIARMKAANSGTHGDRLDPEALK